MFLWIKRLLYKSELTPQEQISKGQKFALKDESPWPTAGYGTVEILDAKQGWVRYRMGSVFPDERLQEERFRAIYTKVE